MISRPPMYNWQKEALWIWKGAGDPPDDETCGKWRPDMTVAAVTGSGKTRLALEVCEDWLKYSEIPEWRFKEMITIVVPRTALMMQWYDTMIEWGIDPALIGRVGGGSIKGWKAQPSNLYNIVSLQTLAKGQPEYMTTFTKSTSHLVIVDECHNLRGAKMRQALSPKNCPADRVLGLSATPHPTDEAREVVESLCGPIRYSYRYAQALADGVIPPFEIKAIQIPLNVEENGEVSQITNQITSVMKEARNEYGAEAQRLYAIAKALGMKRKRVLNRCKSRFHMALRVLSRHGADTPTMVFHDSIEDIERLAQMTSYLQPALYHSKGKGAGELEKFAQGKTNHLYSCIALSEGFNAPRVKVAIMMSGPNAPLRRIQTLGRCLRGDGSVVNQIYFFYVAGTKDEQGLHNLLEAGDIPQTIKIGEKEIAVVKHYKSSGHWIEPIDPPKNPESFKPLYSDDIKEMTWDDFVNGFK